jgi:hypothetical protein
LKGPSERAALFLLVVARGTLGRFASLVSTMTKMLLPLLLLAAAGCRKDQPAAPTAEQSAQLNEAESMLNAAGNEEGPEANGSGPSNSSN